MKVLFIVLLPDMSIYILKIWIFISGNMHNRCIPMEVNRVEILLDLFKPFLVLGAIFALIMLAFGVLAIVGLNE